MQTARVVSHGLGLMTFFVSAVIAVGPAAAQSIDEIVVSARKKEESLQQVPISITAFTGKDLRERNINNAYDLATFTPNFNFTSNIVGRRLDAPTIRGQFSPLLGGSPAQGAGNVAFFVDGVFVTGTVATQPVENLERIEVLRGPQAAKFGRGAFAGAVNYVSRAPSNDYEGEVNLQVGEEEDYKTSGWFSGPIIKDELLFFASGTYESWDGEWENGLVPCDDRADDGNGCTFVQANLGTWPDQAPTSSTTPDSTRLGGEETWNLTGKLEWRPRDDFGINFKASYSETDDDHYAMYFSDQTNCFGPGDRPTDPNNPADSGFSPGWFCGELKVDGLANQMNIADFKTGASSFYGTAKAAPFIGTKTDTTLYLTELEYDPGEWSIRARYAHNEQNSEQYRDLDRGPYLGPLDINVFDAGETSKFDDDSFELIVNSPVDERFRASAGVYYYEADEEAKQRDFTGVCRFNFGDPRLQPNPGGDPNNPDDDFIEVYEGDPGYAAASKSRISEANVKNQAVFGSLAYDVTDRLTAEFEARYAKDTPSRKSARGVSAEDDFTSFTPRYTLNYQATDDALVYASAAKGTKPGGFFFAFFDVDVLPSDTQAALADGDALFEEEEAWTYEIGAKTSWFDNRLIFNAAAFYIDWTNQGINETVDIPTTCNGIPLQEPNNVLVNAGESRVYGVELDAQLAVTDNLFLTLAYGWQDTELEKFNSLTYADLTGISDPTLANDGNVSGNEAPRVPKHNVTASATYTRSINIDTDWFARTDFVYESRQWITAVNEAELGDTYLLNARTGFETDKLTAALYVDNILDEDTPVLVSDFPNFSAPLQRLTTSFPMAPRRGRNYGFNLSYRFGGR